MRLERQGPHRVPVALGLSSLFLAVAIALARGAFADACLGAAVLGLVAYRGLAMGTLAAGTAVLVGALGAWLGGLGSVVLAGLVGAWLEALSRKETRLRRANLVVPWVPRASRLMVLAAPGFVFAGAWALTSR